MIYKTTYHSPVGTLFITSDGENITGLYLKNIETDEPVVPADNLPVFYAVKGWLDEYFSGNNPDPSVLPLKPEGSTFRKQVWNLLLEIPYGKATTYGTLAKKISPVMSAQAVGTAVGHNPISIIIPCHRVLPADGSIGNYGWGPEIKERLLQHEGAINISFV